MENTVVKDELKIVRAKVDALKEKVETLPQENNRLEAEFEELTKLTKKDDAFLVFASSLQVIRQLLTSKLKNRKSDKEAEKDIKGNEKNYSNRSNEKYYASIEEIRTNPVPFDCIQKEPELKRSSEFPKLSGFNHRYKALGHDPLLGLIVGTVNIMTKTITVTEGGKSIKTYHVHTGVGIRTSTDAFGNVNVSPYKIDKISDVASTIVAFEKVAQRINQEGKQGWAALGAALGKEVIHLLSDIRTEKSLPLPGLSLISPNLPRLMNFAGIDMYSFSMFTLDAVVANIINFIIVKLHELCYDPEIDGTPDVYEVRTRKILMYSGEIALVSSTVQTAVRAYLGDASALRKFDFGGSLITLSNLWNSPLEIARIKHEYKTSRLEKYIKLKQE